MTDVAVFDTKPYDRASLSAAGADLRWRFLEFRLSAESAGSGGKPFLEGTLLVSGRTK